MSLEELEKNKVKTEIAKNVAAIFAMLVAATWALILFFSIDIKKATSDIKEAELKLIKTQYEIVQLKSKQHKTLELNLTHENTFQDVDGKYSAVFKLSAKNVGLTPLNIDLTGEETFTLTKLGKKFNNEHVAVDKVYTAKPFNRITHKILRSISGISIAPGTTQTQLYYVQVDEPGLYFVSSLVLVPDYLKTEKDKEIEERDGLPLVWGAQVYTEISKSNKSK